LEFDLNGYLEGLKSPEGYPMIKVKYELFNTLHGLVDLEV